MPIAFEQVSYSYSAPAKKKRGKKAAEIPAVGDAPALGQTDADIAPCAADATNAAASNAPRPLWGNPEGKTSPSRSKTGNFSASQATREAVRARSSST